MLKIVRVYSSILCIRSRTGINQEKVKIYPRSNRQLFIWIYVVLERDLFALFKPEYFFASQTYLSLSVDSAHSGNREIYRLSSGFLSTFVHNASVPAMSNVRPTRSISQLTIALAAQFRTRLLVVDLMRFSSRSRTAVSSPISQS